MSLRAPRPVDCFEREDNDRGLVPVGLECNEEEAATPNMGVTVKKIVVERGFGSRPPCAVQVYEPLERRVQPRA